MQPDVYERHAGAGKLGYAAAPLALLGLPMVALSSRGVVFALNGVFLLGLAAVALTVRTSCTVDRRRRHAERWWGLLVPFSRTVRSLDDFATLAVRRRRVGGKNAHDVFDVLLEGSGEPFAAFSSADYQESRVEAERLARAVEFDVHDHAADPEEVRDHRFLDESLAQRVRRLGERPALPPQPPGCPVGLRTSGPSATLEVPAPGLGAGEWVLLGVLGFVAFLMVLGLGVPVVFMLTSAKAAAPGAAAPPYWLLASLPLVGLVLPALVALPLLRPAVSSATVTVGGRGIEVTERWWFGATTCALDGSKVEDVALRERGDRLPESVAVVSDERTLGLGRGLRPEDLRWLRSALVHFLVGEG